MDREYVSSNVKNYLAYWYIIFSAHEYIRKHKMLCKLESKLFSLYWFVLIYLDRLWNMLFC